MRVIADTNIIVSAIFFKGKPRKFLQEWFNDQFDLVCSREIYEEYTTVLERISGKYKNEIHGIIPLLENKLIFIENHYYDHYSRDPDDDKFINCASSAKALYLVSGDKDLLSLNQNADIKIVTVSDFLDYLK